MTRLAAAFVAIAGVLASPAGAQTYPNKPIRLIVGFTPGGSNDVSARLLASKLSPLLGRSVVVDNRPGAGGHVGANLVAKAAPDGYTLFFTTAGVICVNPHFKPDMPFHPINDFEFVAFMSDYASVMATHPKLAVTDLRGFVAAAKAAPGKYNAATAGLGATQHIAFIVMNHLLDLKMELINYPGTAQATAAIVKGEVAVGIAAVSTMKSFIDAGSLVPLAVLRDKRSAVLPAVPTIVEAGFPEFLKNGSWGGRQFVLAPRGTPREIVAKLNGAIQQAMQDPDMKLKLRDLGQEDISGAAPEKVREIVKREYDTWGEVIRRYDIKAQQ